MCSHSKLVVNMREPRYAGVAMSAGDVSPKPPLRSGKDACVHAYLESGQHNMCSKVLWRLVLKDWKEKEPGCVVRRR